ncbi:MAG: hypothetical protein Q9191_001939 [Dirinaria sp. TL-2023a]
MPVLRPLFSRALDSSSYGGKQKAYPTTDYKQRLGRSKASAPGKSCDESGLMDASYFELGPPQNNHITISTTQEQPSRNDHGIIKTQVFGTDVASQHKVTACFKMEALKQTSGAMAGKSVLEDDVEQGKYRVERTGKRF